MANPFIINRNALLQVLPRLGLLIQSQNAPPVAEQPDRSNYDVSSAAGELTDSVSVPEFGVTNFQKKRNRVKKQLMVEIEDIF